MKTKKYYRDLIAKSKEDAFEIAREVVEKYGTHTKVRGERTCFARSKDPWNCEVHGFSIYKRKFYTDIYWQGDSTDGFYSIPFEESIQGKTIYRKVDGPYEIHGNLKITSDMVYEALQDFSNRYLTVTKEN